MKRPLVAFILSLFTFFGGHYYNGRWAKALLFAALLAVGVATALLTTYHISLHPQWREQLYNADLIGKTGTLQILLGLVTLAVVATWIASALTAAFDARTAQREAGPEATQESPLVRNLAAVATCGVCLAVLAAIPGLWYATTWLPNLTTYGTVVLPMPLSSQAPLRLDLPLPPIETVPPQSRAGYLGSCSSCVEEFDWNSQKYLAPSSGTIQGRVRADGKPVGGLRVRLLFATDLRTEFGTSDNDGIYSILVPPGKYRSVGWEIDESSARNVLAGKIDVMKDPRLEQQRNRVMTVQANTVTTGPDFDFVSSVVRIWPINGIHVRADVVFEWKPYPGASYYILSVTDFGTNPRAAGRFSQDLWATHITGTTTTAALLGHRLEAGHYYSWKVRADDANDEEISRSGDDWEVAFKVE